MTSNVLKSLPITEDKVILAATVAVKYKIPFDEISTKMLAKCLKFHLQKTRSKGKGELWTQFCALVNDNSGRSLKERLTGTPFVNMKIHRNFLKARLNKVSL